MLITTTEPKRWEDLQTACADILQQCGFLAEVEKNIPLVRGSASIDVYAEEHLSGRVYTTMVECKNWTSNVPQHVVHSFRTVVEDAGGNVGYIVSKAGFQSGAYEAAKNTNINLVTWHQFQNIFLNQWFKKHFTQMVSDQLERLSDYLEIVICVEDWYKNLNEKDVIEFKNLQDEHRFLETLFAICLPYRYIMEQNSPILPLPLNNFKDIPSNLPSSLTSSVGYLEFFEELCRYCKPIMQQFYSFEEKGRNC